jgi:hypothetical protein
MTDTAFPHAQAPNICSTSFVTAPIVVLVDSTTFWAVMKFAEDTGPKLARVCELLPSREIRKFVISIMLTLL